MIWTNKGHEFDDTYKRIATKDSFYLYGAGDYGCLFYNVMKEKINILGFIDNDKEKQKNGVLGEKVYSFEEISLTPNQGIILTISQFARASAIKSMEPFGYKEGEDFFFFEIFLMVYHLYKYDKVYMSSISFLPSTTCNLNCRHCLNFNPFAKKYYVREYKNLVHDIDLFFSRVDRIMIFHLSGGEPFLYKYLGDIIRYIDEKYGERIDAFRTVTNGSVIPGEEILCALRDCNVELTVDDYRDAEPNTASNFEKLIPLLDEYKVNYVINKAEEWVDLAPEKTDFSKESDEFLARHFDECAQTWHELRDGKLYLCNYAAYGTVAGLAGEDAEETYDLSQSGEAEDKYLMEFRLGYSEKGYTNFCKRCMGFTTKTEAVKPGVQVKRGEPIQ